MVSIWNNGTYMTYILYVPMRQSRVFSQTLERDCGRRFPGVQRPIPNPTLPPTKLILLSRNLTFWFLQRGFESMLGKTVFFWGPIWCVYNGFLSYIQLYLTGYLIFDPWPAEHRRLLQTGRQICIQDKIWTSIRVIKIRLIKMALNNIQWAEKTKKKNYSINFYFQLVKKQSYLTNKDCRRWC